LWRGEVIEMWDLETSARADEVFAELVYSDSEWLRAEFEALMTAGFGAPPRFPILPAPAWVPPIGGPGPIGSGGSDIAGGVPQENPFRHRHGRQRSPPLVD
jgi:hypothetical protein